jgi:hypothetical protein
VQPHNDAVVHEAAEYGLAQRMWGSAAVHAASRVCILGPGWNCFTRRRSQLMRQRCRPSGGRDTPHVPSWRVRLSRSRTCAFKV